MTYIQTDMKIPTVVTADYVLRETGIDISLPMMVDYFNPLIFPEGVRVLTN
jgi:hypothetical protein